MSDVIVLEPTVTYYHIMIHEYNLHNASEYSDDMIVTACGIAITDFDDREEKFHRYIHWASSPAYPVTCESCVFANMKKLQ